MTLYFVSRKNENPHDQYGAYTIDAIDPDDACRIISENRIFGENENLMPLIIRELHGNTLGKLNIGYYNYQFLKSLETIKMNDNISPCQQDCFWYSNDDIYYATPYRTCAYYKCNIFLNKNKYYKDGDMLEPSTCDKFIRWDDVETMMKNCVDDIGKLNHKV
jgi:hypothetical protein